MKLTFKKPGAGMLLNIGSLVAGIAGFVINGEKEKRAKAEAIEKAAEKAYEKVMEQLSSKN